MKKLTMLVLAGAALNGCGSSGHGGGGGGDNPSGNNNGSISEIDVVNEVAPGFVNTGTREQIKAAVDKSYEIYENQGYLLSLASSKINNILLADHRDDKIATGATCRSLDIDNMSSKDGISGTTYSREFFHDKEERYKEIPSNNKPYAGISIDAGVLVDVGLNGNKLLHVTKLNVNDMGFICAILQDFDQQTVKAKCHNWLPNITGTITNDDNFELGKATRVRHRKFDADFNLDITTKIEQTGANTSRAMITDNSDIREFQYVSAELDWTEDPKYNTTLNCKIVKINEQR